MCRTNKRSNKKRRYTNYRHTASGVVSLVNAGLARLMPAPAEEFPCCTDGQSLCSDAPSSQVLIQLTPTSISRRSAPPAAGGTSETKARRTRPNHFVAQLEAASARDNDFIIVAHRRELQMNAAIQEQTELKLALDLSLQEEVSRNVVTHSGSATCTTSDLHPMTVVSSCHTFNDTNGVSSPSLASSPCMLER